MQRADSAKLVATAVNQRFNLKVEGGWKFIRKTAVILIAAIVGLVSACAQTTSGSIAGSVLDAQQSAVGSATVTVTDTSRGFTQNTTTDREGRFVFSQLSPGTYTLSITAAGFKKNERTNIGLVANDRLALGNIILEIGATTDTITVTAEATLVQSESAERSLAIQGEILRSVAVNGRGFTPLASIVPGIIFNTNNGSSDAITNIFANGLRSSANNLTLDGVAAVDTGNNGTLLSLNLDSVSEFKVLTSNYQAEYGRSAGAQISAVTRGGTRDFHGSAYGFRRHDGMNANTWLNNRDSTFNNKITKPRLDQRDLGFTIGGPIYIPKVFNTDRQKLFFFYSHEDQKRLIPPASPTRVTVPTALERAGDFSQTVDNAGNPFPYIRDTTTGLPCSAASTAGCFSADGVLGRIPASRLYGLGLNVLKMYPLPNATGVGFNYSTQDASSQPQIQDLVRIDYNLTSSWRVSGRYIKVKNDQVLPYGSFVLGTNMPDFNVVLPNPRNSYAITVTGAINPTTVFEATIGGSHNSIDINPANNKFNRTGLGLTGFPVAYPSAVKIDSPPQFIFNGGRIANGPNIGSNNAPFYNFNTTRDWSASISKTLQQHTIKVGAFWQNSFKPQSSFANNNGVYNFVDNTANPLDSQFGFANAALGVYNTFTQASGYFIGKYRYNNVEWFAQDNWKVNSRLTLDFGMRFYWIQPQYDEDLLTANFLPDRFNSGDAPRLYAPVCIGANPCSGANRRAIDPSVAATGAQPLAGNTIDGAYVGRIVPNSGKLLNGIVQAGAGIEKGLYKNRGVHFAPRFGFAYDLLGNQKTVLRGGGGMFYDRPQGNVVFDLLTNPPTTLAPTFNFGQISQVGSGPALLAPPALVAYDRKGKSPTSYSFNMGVQQKLPFESVLDVSYVGSVGSHLLQRRNINAPQYGAAYQAGNQDPTTAFNSNGSSALLVDFLRPYQGFGNISYIEPASSSNYHSLQMSLNRRFSKGLLLGVTHTWSKALGTQGADLPGINSFGAPRTDTNNRLANYGPQDFDRRHNFNINWVYELPKATRNRSLGLALNDWQISGIYRYQTGAPYNVGFTIPGLSSYGVTGTQQNEGGRIVVTGNPGSGRSSDPYRQFNVDAFTTPGLGSLGLESGRNFLYRSPINALDASLSKEFKVTEQVKFELRLDTFNALNHTQFDGVNSTLNVTSLTNRTPTNLASDGGNRNGFGSISSVRPPRNMQISARFQF
jgi:hypothetical protein